MRAFVRAERAVVRTRRTWPIDRSSDFGHNRAMPRPRAAKPDDRRSLIADAAIAELAASGSRGLTHRAIDRRLALPLGSTSYYFRTRESLIEAANDRLAALDAADVAETALTPTALEALLDRWLAPANRERLVARFELYLDAARSDGHPLTASRKQFVARTQKALASAGAASPRVAALALVALSDGLLLHTMLGTAPTRAERSALLASVVAAFR